MFPSNFAIGLVGLAALALARPSLDKRGGFPGVATFNDYIKQVTRLTTM